MKIIKRDLREEVFTFDKIKNAIKKAYRACHIKVSNEDLNIICNNIEQILKDKQFITVEEVQDLVENELMNIKAFDVAKAYILYRKQRSDERLVINEFRKYIKDENIIKILENISKEYSIDSYSVKELSKKFINLYSENVNSLDILIKASSELITQDKPNWEFIASRLFFYKLDKSITSKEATYNIRNFYEKLKWLTDNLLYGRYILDSYTKDEVLELEKYMDHKRNNLLTYSSIHLLSKRYLIVDHDHNTLERPQEMFMGIAMHLAIPEKENKLFWAKKIYDILSTLKVTVATPTLSNARKPFHQLSSCFEDVMPDNLIGIYRTINNFAQVSKFGGGMGIYIGKVRAVGSDIRGFKGVAGGVLKWIKLCNDTAIAVDQLGVRQGSVAIYIDIWHKDVLEFLQLKTNNGDDRMKAHDIFPGICFPDYFWKLLKTNKDAFWYMMCPHEVQTIKGYCLEDFWGDEWEKRYLDCVADNRINKRSIKIIDLAKLFLKSVIETGTPFVFNRDTVNRANPNKHNGMIYCSNLCTEIAQNQREIQTKSISVVDEDGQQIVIEKTIPGDFVVCNLASLVLGNIDVNNDGELRDVIRTIVRALDNVIDLNFYPLEYARLTNQKMRPIGLGISGYHHLLAKLKIKWESQEHLEFVDKLFEKINYYTIEASSEIAKEKGSYYYFEGSDWQNGDYFKLRNYISDQWLNLAKKVKEDGLRNGYLLAIAPTSSTSIISGTSAGTDPIMNIFFLEEKKGNIIPRVAPDLNDTTRWYYKIAHNINQEWIIDAASIRQRHIDQAQSVNLFITTDTSYGAVLKLYVRAWEKGVKTIYYIRSKSLEIEECETCAS